MLFVAQWATGEIGMIYHSWNIAQHLSKHWVSLSGDKGKIHFEIGKPELQIEQTDSYRSIHLSTPPNGLLNMAKEFLESIKGNRIPQIDGHEGLKDLWLVNKAYESVNRRVPVEISEENYLSDNSPS